MDPRDWTGIAPATIAQRVLTHARDGSVILLHIGPYHTAAALPSIIAGLALRGFGFVTLATPEEAQAARDALDGSMQAMSLRHTVRKKRRWLAGAVAALALAGVAAENGTHASARDPGLPADPVSGAVSVSIRDLEPGDRLVQPVLQCIF